MPETYVDHAPLVCYGAAMSRTILSFGDLVIDVSTITAAHLRLDRLGVVVHHSGAVHGVDAKDEEQARVWLGCIANAMQGPAPEECGR